MTSRGSNRTIGRRVVGSAILMASCASVISAANIGLIQGAKITGQKTENIRFVRPNGQSRMHP